MTSGGHDLDEVDAPDEPRTIVEYATETGLPVAAHAHSTPTITATVDAGVTTIEHCTWMRSEDHDIEPVVECMATLGVPETLDTLRHLVLAAGRPQTAPTQPERPRRWLANECSM